MDITRKPLEEYVDDFRSISESIIEINEETNEKTYYIDGIWAQLELWNRNKRWYQKKEGEQVVEDFNGNRIPNRDKIFGELDHSKDSSPQFSRMSHIFENPLRIEGNDIYTKARVLSDTKEGQTLKVVLDEKLKYGVSTKSLGMLSKYKKNGVNGNLVSHWILKNVGDVVVDQSAPGATPKAIIEMIVENDPRMELIYGYEAITEVKKVLKRTKKAEIDDNLKALWKKIWEYEI